MSRCEAKAIWRRGVTIDTRVELHRKTLTCLLVTRQRKASSLGQGANRLTPPAAQVVRRNADGPTFEVEGLVDSFAQETGFPRSTLIPSLGYLPRNRGCGASSHRNSSLSLRQGSQACVASDLRSLSPSGAFACLPSALPPDTIDLGLGPFWFGWVQLLEMGGTRCDAFLARRHTRAGCGVTTPSDWK
jgi:hypothetical protein